MYILLQYLIFRYAPISIKGYSTHILEIEKQGFILKETYHCPTSLSERYDNYFVRYLPNTSFFYLWHFLCIKIYNISRMIVLTFVYNVNMFSSFIRISWIFFPKFSAFSCCHFLKHDGMLRELFYCLWRGSNMSVVCTEDEIIFIYLECVLRKMAKNSCHVTKNL